MRSNFNCGDWCDCECLQALTSIYNKQFILLMSDPTVLVGCSTNTLASIPFKFSLDTMLHPCHTLISTAQSSDILSLMPLLKVSCRMNSVILYLLPIRVASAQPQVDCYTMRHVMGFGSSAAWRSRQRHYQAATARYRCIPFALPSATESNRRCLESPLPRHIRSIPSQFRGSRFSPQPSMD